MIYVAHDPNMRRAEKDRCIACGGFARRGERVRPVLIVSGVGPDPRGYGKVLTVVAQQNALVPEFEYKHHRCDDPYLRGVSKIARLEKPMSKAHEFEEIEPRGTDYACATCHVEFKRGDRIVWVHAVLGVGTDPVDNRKAAAISGNAEYHHALTCDPTVAHG